jgi:hypothetical protein
LDILYEFDLIPELVEVALPLQFVQRMLTDLSNYPLNFEPVLADPLGKRDGAPELVEG